MSDALALASCRWIVFDVTGTLLTPDPPAVAVYRQAALRLGQEIDLAIVRRRFRAAVARHYGSDAAEVPLASAGRSAGGREAEDAVERARWRRIVADTLPELTAPQADEAFAELWEHFAGPHHWRLVNGVDRLVSGLLADQRKLAIATNLDRRVHRLLDAHRPLDQIRRRFLSSEIGWAKPDRRFFDYVATALAVPPDQIAMVGDDPVNDLNGSRRAGWRAVPIEQLLRE